MPNIVDRFFWPNELGPIINCILALSKGHMNENALGFALY